MGTGLSKFSIAMDKLHTNIVINFKKQVFYEGSWPRIVEVVQLYWRWSRLFIHGNITVVSC